MKRLFVFIIKNYKKYFSPALPRAYRFTPTSSEYTIEAFEVHGAFVGFFLTAYRLLRCNPFCKGGYDPVPAKRKKIK